MSEATRSLLARAVVDIAKSVIQVHAVDATARRLVADALKWVGPHSCQTYPCTADNSTFLLPPATRKLRRPGRSLRR